MSAGLADATKGSGSKLGWLANVLGWMPDPGTGGSDAPPRRFWVLPSKEEPRTLVPADRRLAGQALRTFNDSMTQLSRLRRAALGSLLAHGLDRLLRLDTVDMVPSEPGTSSLAGHLEEVFGCPVEVGVALGAELRPNLKPVLQVLTRTGEVIGFAKIGWNDLTDHLVRNEAASLELLRTIQPRTFDVPELLHQGDWNGRALIVVSPGPRPLIRRCGRNAPPPLDVEIEVARSAWVSNEPLGSSGYVAGLRDRVAASTPEHAVRLTETLELVLARFGDAEIPFGAWHGDWAPWNMSRMNGRLFVWDWERYGGPVPQGFDHVHLRFQLDHQVAGRSLAEAAARATRSLSASGISPEIGDAALGPVVRLYLLERIVRVEEGRAAGVPVRSDLTPALIELLAGR